MNAARPPVIGGPSAPPPPVFTLGSALRWLGHNCPHHCCSEPIDTLDASVWFLRRGQQFPTFPLQTLVLVDPPTTGNPLAGIHQMIYQVDCCTRGDAIQVRHRPRTLRAYCDLRVHRQPVSLLVSNRPTRSSDPTEAHLRAAAETKSTTW
jgi:hypothetical protein